MLLFILQRQVLCYIMFNSNTSHVIVYRLNPRLKVIRLSNSNTSHVIVYREFEGGELAIDIFKYISCYCLSINGCRKKQEN